MRTKRTRAIAVAALAVAAVTLPVQAAAGVDPFSASATVTAQAGMATIPSLSAGIVDRDTDWLQADVSWETPVIRSDVTADYVITRTVAGVEKVLHPVLAEDAGRVGFIDDFKIDTPPEEGWTCEAGSLWWDGGFCIPELGTEVSYRVDYTALGWAPSDPLMLDATWKDPCGPRGGEITIFC